MCWMRFWDAEDADCRAWREAAETMAKSAVCDLVVGPPWSRLRWRFVVLMWMMLVMFPDECVLLSVLMVTMLVVFPEEWVLLFVVLVA